jgi:hypothetical protein
MADRVLRRWAIRCLWKIELLLFGFATSAPLRAPLRAG